MCRMFAYFSDQASSLSDLLVHLPNSLVAQSRRDRSGEVHGDGWGIGYYNDDGQPLVVRGIRSAHDDEQLLQLADRIHTHIAIGHVRQASVGQVSVENTHPFTYGPWLFAHNGTVPHFAQVSEHLTRETDPQLLAHRYGATDSEAVFLWLLSCFQREGIRLNHDSPHDLHDRADVLGLVELLGESIRRLSGWAAAIEPDDICRLNFLLTDGHLLVATRYQHSLCRLDRQWPADEAAGRASPARAVIVASEPISEEPWKEVPDRSILAVGANFHSFTHPF